jgi:hypothetical protein
VRRRCHVVPQRVRRQADVTTRSQRKHRPSARPSPLNRTVDGPRKRSESARRPSVLWDPTATSLVGPGLRVRPEAESRPSWDRLVGQRQLSAGLGNSQSQPQAVFDEGLLTGIPRFSAWSEGCSSRNDRRSFFKGGANRASEPQPEIPDMEVMPNPSIERTPNSRLRRLLAAAHVKREASRCRALLR